MNCRGDYLATARATRNEPWTLTSKILLQESMGYSTASLDSVIPAKQRSISTPSKCWATPLTASSTEPSSVTSTSLKTVSGGSLFWYKPWRCARAFSPHSGLTSKIAKYATPCSSSARAQTNPSPWAPPVTPETSAERPIGMVLRTLTNGFLPSKWKSYCRSLRWRLFWVLNIGNWLRWWRVFGDWEWCHEFDLALWWTCVGSHRCFYICCFSEEVRIK